MPGLTITTGARPAPAATRGTTSSAGANAGATGASTTNHQRRTSSPARPPVSPITPTLGPRQVSSSPPNNNNNNTTTTNTIPDFALGRPTFTHTTQPDQIGTVPPPAQPINFDENPDVLALKSAISILQLQRARATADIQSLSRAKAAALADPAAFVADLVAGRVGTERGGETLLLGGRRAAEDGLAEGEEEEESDEDEDEDEDDDENDDDDADADDDEQGSTTPRSRSGRRVLGRMGKGEIDGTDREMSTTDGAGGRRRRTTHKRKDTSAAAAGPADWRKLPRPQNVVRCPPINWAQYGVVGESLDKLHAEQLAAPTPGAPLVLGPGGTYEPGLADQNQLAGAAGGEPPRRLVGIAAPYTPGKDKLEKKGKSGKR